MPDFGYAQSSAYRRIYPEPVLLTEDEQQRLDSLRAEYTALNDAWYASDADEALERLDELEKLIADIEDREGVWSPEQLAIAGAVVSLDHAGKVKIERGFVKPEDMPKQSKKTKSASGPGDANAEAVEAETSGLSAALTATLLDVPDKGFATIVYALVLQQEDAESQNTSAQFLHRQKTRKINYIFQLVI